MPRKRLQKTSREITAQKESTEVSSDFLKKEKPARPRTITREYSKERGGQEIGRKRPQLGKRGRPVSEKKKAQARRPRRQRGSNWVKKGEEKVLAISTARSSKRKTKVCRRQTLKR